MGNCLVTKLKGVVDNPDLLKLGECRLKVKNTGSAVAKLYFNCANRAGQDDTITFDHAIPYYQNEVLKEANTVIHLSNGSQTQWVLQPGEEVVGSISYKYRCYYLNDDYKNFDLTFEGFDFFEEGFVEITTNTAHILSDIKIDPFCGTRTERFFLGGLRNSSKISGSIDNLSSSANLKHLAISNCTNITGNIENLVNCLQVTGLEIKNDPIHGSLNTLFDAWAAAGKTGSMLLTFAGSQCTLTGVTTYPDNKVTFSNGSWTVSNWNA